MCYKHQGVDEAYYERTDEPLLSFGKLKNELPQIRVLISDVIANIDGKKLMENLRTSEKKYVY